MITLANRYIKDVMTYFGVRVFNEEDSLLRNVEHIDNWHLTMGDSDVF